MSHVTIRNHQLDLEDRLRWLAMDIDNLIWKLSENKYIDDDVFAKLHKKVDILKETNDLCKGL
jgi:hypothetical protein